MKVDVLDGLFTEQGRVGGEGAEEGEVDEAGADDAELEELH